MKLPICALLICKDCKHFIGDTQECRNYKHTDIITGKITYDDARFARINLCGEEGNSFEKNNFKLLTVPYYFIKKEWWILIIPLVWFNVWF
jgi:hypothetical protein